MPDRTSGEFFNGDHVTTHGACTLNICRIFRNDVHYVVGKSDYHKDWNMMQVPRRIGQTPNGTATTWAVSFDMPSSLCCAKATLRLSFAGTESRTLDVQMNGKPAGALTDLLNTAVIHRDADRGYWLEKAVAFDAAYDEGRDQ